MSTPSGRGLTGRGVAVLVLGALLLTAGLLWRYPLVAGLGGCLAALVLAELTAVLTAGAVRVVRRVEPRVVVRHEGSHGHLLVHGRRRRGLVRVDVADRVDGTLVPVTLPDVVASGQPPAEVTYPVPTPRRGLVTVGPVQVRLTGLTGMAARSTETGSRDQVRVLPRRIPLAAMMRGTRRAVVGAEESMELGGTDLVGLHEYTMGDDLRRLHWATSARTGTLMVREDAEPSEAHVCVVLDDRASAYRGDEELFEEAVELTAALCRTALDTGAPLRFHTVADRHHVHAPGTAAGRPRPEAAELDLLFAEVGLGDSLARVDLDAGSDVVVIVTGPGAEVRELGLLAGTAPTRVVAIADPAPLVSAQQDAGTLVLRAASSVSLAMLWDEAVARS